VSSFELILGQFEIEQNDPEIIFGALGTEIPFMAGGNSTVERFGCDAQIEL
jgi:hypothetical protein